MTFGEEDRLALRQVVDRLAIHDCVHRYARAIDRLDEELLLSVFHPDAVLDYGTARASFLGSPCEFADWAIPRNRELTEGTQHFVTNHVADLDGDVAHAETYFLTALEIAGKGHHRLGGGRYLDRFERRDGDWRISTRVVVAQWSTVVHPDGSDALPLHLPRRDRDDLSYLRPLEARLD